MAVICFSKQIPYVVAAGIGPGLCTSILAVAQQFHRITQEWNPHGPGEAGGFRRDCLAIHLGLRPVQPTRNFQVPFLNGAPSARLA